MYLYGKTVNALKNTLPPMMMSSFSYNDTFTLKLLHVCLLER